MLISWPWAVWCWLPKVWWERSIQDCTVSTIFWWYLLPTPYEFCWGRLEFIFFMTSMTSTWYIYIYNKCQHLHRLRNLHFLRATWAWSRFWSWIRFPIPQLSNTYMTVYVLYNHACKWPFFKLNQVFEFEITIQHTISFEITHRWISCLDFKLLPPGLRHSPLIGSRMAIFSRCRRPWMAQMLGRSG